MSRIACNYPSRELRIQKSIGIESTNPKFEKSKLMHCFIGTGVWEKLGEKVRERTGKFFRIPSVELIDHVFVRLFFEIGKEEKPPYQEFVDIIQEFLPEHGVKVVEIESNLIDEDGK